MDANQATAILKEVINRAIKKGGIFDNVEEAQAIITAHDFIVNQLAELQQLKADAANNKKT